MNASDRLIKEGEPSMDNPRKVIVGLDLCEDTTHLSCYSYKTLEAVTIQAPIPTVLCVKSETGQWLFGEEAVECAGSGSGVLIDRLLTKAKNDETLVIFQTTVNGISLLERFLRKTLTLIKGYFPEEPITKLVVTVSNTDAALAKSIYKALSLLGIERDRAVVMSHSGAYLYYVLYQDKSLWMNDVGLFDFTKEGFFYYQIHMNRRIKPMVAGLSKQDYSEELNYSIVKQNTDNVSYQLKNITDTILYKQIVSTLYFSGCGFEGGWAEDVIQGLCTGRRIFMGQSLFTEGACYAAKELSGDSGLTDILLLNEDMITASITMSVYHDAKNSELPLIQAGEIWYEVDKSVEVIPDGEAELELNVKNIMTGEVFRERFHINQFVNRSDRTTRLEINLTCTNHNTLLIKITDLGFGELFPGTGADMVFTLEV